MSKNFIEKTVILQKNNDVSENNEMQNSFEVDSPTNNSTEDERLPEN